MKTRVSWDRFYMNIAVAVSERATCDRKHVGCVFVLDNHIICAGYNGSIPGLDHCDEVGHDMDGTHCVRTVHAEANAICQAARHGLSVRGATCYVTASPCWECFKLLASSGIRRVCYQELYRSERVFRAAEQCGIFVEQITD